MACVFHCLILDDLRRNKFLGSCRVWSPSGRSYEEWLTMLPSRRHSPECLEAFLWMLIYLIGSMLLEEDTRQPVNFIRRIIKNKVQQVLSSEPIRINHRGTAIFTFLNLTGSHYPLTSETGATGRICKKHFAGLLVMLQWSFHECDRGCWLPQQVWVFGKRVVRIFTWVVQSKLGGSVDT